MAALFSGAVVIRQNCSAVPLISTPLSLPPPPILLSGSVNSTPRRTSEKWNRTDLSSWLVLLTQHLVPEVHPGRSTSPNVPPRQG